MTRPLRRRPPSVRSLLAALVVVLAVTAVGWSGDPAASQDADPSPSLRLERQTSWVGPDGVFQVTVSADELPPGATIGAVLHRRVTSRAALDAALTDRRPSGSYFTVRARPVSELTALDGTITVSLPVSVGPSATIDGVQLVTPGVYPYSIRVYGPDDQINPVAELVTTMLRLDDPAGQTSTRRLAVGVVVPVQTSLTLAPDGTPVLDDRGAAALTDTISAVAARPDLPLTVSPSAEALELLSARDADGAATVGELRARIARQLLANPYARIDTGAWVQSGLSTEAVVQWLAGVASVRSLLGTEPDYTTTTLDRTVTPAALDLMHQIGVRYAAVPSEQLEPVGGPATTATFAEQFDLDAGESGTIRAVVADDPTAARLASGDDPVLAGHDALAELALLHDLQTSDGQGVAVIVPDGTDPFALTTFLDGLTTRDGSGSGTPGSEMVSPVTLDGLFSATAVAGPDRSGGDQVLERGYLADEPGDLGRYPTALRDTNESLAGLRSLVPPDSPIAAQPAVTTLSSGDRDLTADQRTAVLDAAEQAIDDVSDEIVVAADQVVTLTSSSGRVPLNLENRLQVEAQVRIVMSSAKLDFPEGSVIERVLEPATTTLIELPVETRASGAFPMTVTISSADGTLPVATTTYTVRSTAISGVGLVLSVGAGLFLLVWWGRHFRTARRARKLVASNHPALSGTEPGGYAPADSDPMEGR